MACASSPGVRRLAPPERTVSRVLFRCAVARAPARIIRLGAALLRRSSALTRALALGECFGRAALDSAPIRACSGRGLLRRRSPGCRAWALTPRFQPCLCLHAGCLSHSALPRPSAVSFLLRFPSGFPGSPLATSPPCGARTFLPRAVSARRRSSVRLRQPLAYHSRRPPGPGASAGTPLEYPLNTSEWSDRY